MMKEGDFIALHSQPRSIVHTGLLNEKSVMFEVVFGEDLRSKLVTIHDTQHFDSNPVKSSTVR